MTEPDPFSQVFEGIWKLCEDFPGFADQVRVGNRIKLNQSSRNPIKDVVQAADLPEVILWPTGGETNIHANSSQTRLTRNYVFGTTAGDYRVDEVHFPLQWHILRAMADWGERIGGLSWCGEPFLTDLNLPDVQEGDSDPQLNRNIEGWTSIITVSATMTFTTKLLQFKD